MPQTSRVLLVVIILLVSALRLNAFFNNHFHADEALFASWARLIAIWRDPLLQTQAVDKPPLLFYLQALAFPLFGPAEWAPRLPNMVASILTIPLTAVFSWRLFRSEVTVLLAALIVAMSPMAIQFSSTAFTDPLLTALLIAALLLVVGKPRPFWAGICLGLALLTKHQAWLFVPLFAGMAWACNWRIAHWRKMLAGLVPLILLFLGWQILRTGSVDLLGSQLNNFGGLRFAWSWELQSRLAAWLTLWPTTLSSPVVLLLFLLSIPLVWQPNSGPAGSQKLVGRIIIVFIFAYLSLHWLLAIPVWDRYLLPLIPLTAVIVGRGLGLASKFQVVDSISRARPVLLFFLLAVLFLIQLPGAADARAGRFAVGGRRDADQGAWLVAEFLDQASYGTVLYDHWYSWHWRYAFIDKGIYTSWFAHADGLAEDLHVFGESPGTRYLVLPEDERKLPVLRTINAAGFEAKPLLQTDARPGMILYRLEPS